MLAQVAIEAIKFKRSVHAARKIDASGDKI